MGFTIVHGGASQQQLAGLDSSTKMLAGINQSNRKLDMAQQGMEADEVRYQQELARAIESQDYNRQRQAIADQRTATRFGQQQDAYARGEAERVANEGADARAGELSTGFRGAQGRTGAEGVQADAGYNVFKTAIAGAFGRQASEMFPDAEIAVPGKDYEEFLTQEHFELLDSGDLSTASAERLAQEYSTLQTIRASEGDLNRLKKRAQHYADTVQGVDTEQLKMMVEEFEEQLEAVRKGELDPQAIKGQATSLFNTMAELRSETEFNNLSIEVASGLAQVRSAGTLDTETVDQLGTMLEEAETQADLLRVQGFSGMSPAQFQAFRGAEKATAQLFGGDEFAGDVADAQGAVPPPGAQQADQAPVAASPNVDLFGDSPVFERRQFVGKFMELALSGNLEGQESFLAEQGFTPEQENTFFSAVAEEIKGVSSFEPGDRAAAVERILAKVKPQKGGGSPRARRARGQKSESSPIDMIPGARTIVDALKGAKKGSDAYKKHMEELGRKSMEAWERAQPTGSGN